MIKERWKPTVGWEQFYFTSDRGRVYSVSRTIYTTAGWSRRVGGRLLTQTPNAYGYPVVHLSNPSKTRLVHQLVAEAFIGPRPFGQLTRHKDDVSDHNWHANLCYGTDQDNYDDAVRNGKVTHGVCKRAHLIEGKNVWKPPSMRRSCNACHLARDYFKRRGVLWTELELKLLADGYYAQLMEAA